MRKTFVLVALIFSVAYLSIGQERLDYMGIPVSGEQVTVAPQISLKNQRSNPDGIVNVIPCPFEYVAGAAFDGEHIWVCGYNVYAFYQLSVSDGAVIKTIPTTIQRPYGLAFDGTHLWVNNNNSKTIYQIDTLNGDVIQSFPIPYSDPNYPTGLTWDGSDIWINDSYSPYVIDESDSTFQMSIAGMVLQAFPAHGTFPSGLAFDGEYLWSSDNPAQQIHKIDPTTFSIVETINAPGGLYPNGLAANRRYLWVANTDADSIYQIEINPCQPSLGAISVSTCGSYIVPSGDETYTLSGVYTDTILNSLDCDSVITIDLTVNTPSASSITEMTCESYVSPSGEYIWTTTGIYNDTVLNAAGCDSVITIDLTVNTPIASFITEEVCEPYVSPSGEYTWTTTGIYNDTILNAAGCDSVITIDLTVNSVNIAVNLNEATITALALNADYRWLNCNDDFSVIPGETDQSFTATVNGDYAAEITMNGCVDTSDCVSVINVGITKNGFNDGFVVYPNPTHGKVIVELGEVNEDIIIETRNLQGELIDTREVGQSERLEIEIKGSPVVYYLSIKAAGNKYATIRMVKV